MFIDKLITVSFNMFFLMLIAILILIFIWNIICFERGFFVHSINEPRFIVHSIEFLYWLCFVGVLNTIINLKT